MATAPEATAVIPSGTCMAAMDRKTGSVEGIGIPAMLVEPLSTAATLQ